MKTKLLNQQETPVKSKILRISRFILHQPIFFPTIHSSLRQEFFDALLIKLKLSKLI